MQLGGEYPARSRARTPLAIMSRRIGIVPVDFAFQELLNDDLRLKSLHHLRVKRGRGRVGDQFEMLGQHGPQEAFGERVMEEDAAWLSDVARSPNLRLD